MSRVTFNLDFVFPIVHHYVRYIKLSIFLKRIELSIPHAMFMILLSTSKLY